MSQLKIQFKQMMTGFEEYPNGNIHAKCHGCITIWTIYLKMSPTALLHVVNLFLCFQLSFCVCVGSSSSGLSIFFYAIVCFDVFLNAVSVLLYYLSHCAQCQCASSQSLFRITCWLQFSDVHGSIHFYYWPVKGIIIYWLQCSVDILYSLHA